MIMRIFLACSECGGVVTMVAAKNFEEAYALTLARNLGEFLVEIDEEIFDEIANYVDKLGNEFDQVW